MANNKTDERINVSIRNFGASLEALAESFRRMSAALLKIEMPSIQQIAELRMNELRQKYGVFRFVIPEWHRWNRIRNEARNGK